MTAPGLRSRLLAQPSWSGAAAGLVFWFASLTPTLIPRGWLTQSLVSGVCLALGYAIGVLIGRVVGAVIARWRQVPSPQLRRRAWLALGALWIAALLGGSELWLRWQRDQLDVMGMPSIGGGDAVLATVTGLAVAVLIVIVVRLAVHGGTLLHGRVARRVPSRNAAVVVTAGLLALGMVLIGGGLVAGVSGWAGSHYGADNEITEDGITPPTSAAVSGSPESLVPWNTLGRTGRTFTATATTAADLARFHGPAAPVTEPVRVYVGVRSADTLQARADLAVRELERTGGFDRSVLVVWIPTGSGWMISEAAEAVEQLHAGDTAIVGIQYSYLPSLFAVFLDAGLAEEAGSILFSTVAERWSRLPADSRPKLLIFGKSLGTAGVEAPFGAVDATSSVANLAARTDGALIVGGKHGNPVLSQVTAERDGGSPVWQPVFDAGRTVRFLNRDPARQQSVPPSSEPRVVYLQHPSDPVPFWGLDALWDPPEWMDHPRGYDVPSAARWFPIVSAVQAVADQIHQLGPPPGFGHDYASEYVDGWAAVLPPAGWTPADTRRLEHFLDHGGSGESGE